ncbi:heterokaryon incompatibility protein-domain-containing protein, partial [Paraphoma chrysanthemicola]
PSLRPFEYDPPDLNMEVVRLIKVLPRDDHGLIQVKMRHSDKLTHYRCLSYMWGQDPAVHHILLNGRVFSARRNLLEFLTFAGQRYANQPLWIDAMCIDQRNLAERSQQVRQMATIYGNAQEVLVWLGKSVRLDGIIEWVQQSHTVEENSRLDKICSNPYWTRAWIAQEILLQANVTIV